MLKRLLHFAGSLFGLVFCFAVPLQAQPASIAKQVGPDLPSFTFNALEALKPIRKIEPQPCFCKNYNNVYYCGHTPFLSRRPYFNFPRPVEIREINLDGLKQIIQVDPKNPRPLLVNFWATWCDPCREEFPDLVKIDSDYRSKGLNFVAVSLDDISEIKTTVPKFLSEMKAEMSAVLLNVNDPEPAIKAIDAAWDGQLPATFLYDREGKVVFKHFGRIKPDELRAAIEKAVSSKQ